MASERPQEALSELSHESYLLKQKIRLAQFSTSPGDVATARMQSSEALLESIHKSRDQYQSFYNVQHLILPTHPAHESRWSLLKAKMDILQTLKTSLEQACNASNDLQQSTKQFLRNVTMRDVDARITKDSRVLEAARVVHDEWSRSERNERNRYLQLCEDISRRMLSRNGCPRATKMLVILYWIAIAFIIYLFKSPQPQSEAVELQLTHDFAIRMVDMFVAFTGAMVAVCIATMTQLEELRRSRRPHDFFYPPKRGDVAAGCILSWSFNFTAFCMLSSLERHNK